MNYKSISLSIMLLFLCFWLKGQTCANDTIFSDVIFLVDNSGSIDSAEYVEFAAIIQATVDRVKADCPEARVGVVHYGGSFGQETVVEYPLSTAIPPSINRQYCTSRDMFNLCVGGGGDDLNHAIGDIMTFISDGTLNHDTANELNLVIFTDAFSFSTSCGQPNCSMILPTTNIDNMKATYGVDVTVVGVSSQAEETLLGIYASPGGDFNGPLWAPDCPGSYDGCVTPRKYIQIEFDDDPGTTADSITTFVACQFQVVAGMMVEAGNMTMICGDLPQSATLTAVGSVGVLPYSYTWSNGAGNTSTVTVSPSATTTYYVTATDAINCSHVDSVTVKVENCCTNLSVDAGADQSVCGNLSESATISASATGSGSPFSYNWDNGLGSGATHTVTPSVTTTYTVTATDDLGCTATDAVTVTVNVCCAGFSVSLGPDQSICGDIPESTSISVTPTGGTGPYTYNWDNGLADQQSHIVMPSVTTTYSVTVTDDDGCVATDQVTVVVNICGPDCEPDTTYTDVIFLVDNSGSIDDSEYAEFKSIIEGSLTGICATCPSSRRAVVHYGGVNGQSTTIEYALGDADETTPVNRQFCTSRDAFGLCVGGGGDDLNHAIGDIMMYIDNGMLMRNPQNQLSLVIFTDAFGFDTTCPQPNCSLILPLTNIDLMKANYGVDVSVIGVSSQAEEALLGIYASPGGSFNGPLWNAECTGSFDGCTTPRKYVQIEFNTPPGDVADMITNFVFCSISIDPEVAVDAGPDVTICGNLSETATLTASVTAGTQPFLYNWSDGLGNTPTVTVSPSVTTTYSVTVVDANDCSAIDSVTVNVISCDTCAADAGTPRPPLEWCLINGTALLPAVKNENVVTPAGYEEVYILTNSDLTILDYSIGTKNFFVNEEGLYRIHMLIAEVSNPSDENYLDLSIIDVGSSNLFLIVNCIHNHDICADFDFPGRVHQVFGPNDMMCMTFENSINLCWDRLDNDGDGLVDCDDPDCQALVVCQENNLLACNDLTDNDKDGLVDCYDPDCFEFTLCFERGDQCNDGQDNDGDGLVDCEDPSCGDSNWCQEDSPFTCVDGKDNDFDGLIDCQEADCQRFIVCSEYTIDACNDGVDNDRDGLVDCADAHCKELLGDICDPTENNWDKCNDGKDNDGDGLVDCADPDCVTAALIAVGDNLDIVVEVDNATCPNNNNGTIRFVGIAQNPDFEFSIDGGFTFSTAFEFSGLAVGPYSIVIKSRHGCLLNTSVDVIGQSCEEICHNGFDDNADGLIDCADPQCINQPNPHNLQIVNIQGAECPSYNNGSFSIANMPTNMRFSIDGANYQSLPKFSNLTDGTYNLLYKDVNGCFGPIEVVIPRATTDSDLDGICDFEDVCPGVNDNLRGTSCDDGNACTVNDTYDDTCQCIGIFADADNDGVCDAEDQCPGQNDDIIGKTCDDGDPCTTNDVNDSNCICAGTYQDEDNDGICDAMDQCPGQDDGLIGTPCNDNDPCTANDTWSSNCECIGTYQDEDQDGVCDVEDQCPGFNNDLIGTACDDGDPCTVDDAYDNRCACVGIFLDSDGDSICDAEDMCPNGDDSLIGTSCDDGNPCTSNDTYTTNCICVGEFKDSDNDGVCDEEDRCPGQDDANCWEACDNGIDDDGDGLVDCADPDCQGQLPLDLRVEESGCDGSSGMIIVLNYDPSVQYFIIAPSQLLLEGINGVFFALEAGVYEVYAIKDCDSAIISVEILLASGCVEICDNGIDDDGDGQVDCEDGDCVDAVSCDSIPGTGAATSGNLNINVMLQGAYNPETGLMHTDLNEGGYLPGQEPTTFFGESTPAGQPFGDAPWFYEGTEGTDMKSRKKSNEPIYDPEVVDWILVSLRTSPEKPSEVWKGAALLYNDGSISFFDLFNIQNYSKNGYYIVVEHRNHLPVMSHIPVEVIDGQISYDFTVQNSFTSILGVGQTQDEDGSFMMLAGNGELIIELSSDIDINARDLMLWIQNNGANSSYFLEDYDMNGDINIKDRILWEKNNGLFTTLQTK